MKKRIIALLICLFLFLPILPLFSSAAGYAASKNSDVFHKESCFYVDRIKDYNLIHFETADEAIRAGKRGCSRCNPGVGNDTSATHKSSDSDNSSYIDGYREGYENGKKIGFDEGVEMGKSEVELDISEKIRSAENDAYYFAYLTSFAVCAPLITFLTCYYWPKKKEALDAQIVSLSKELDFYRSNQEETLFVMNHVAKCANTTSLEVAQQLYISYLKNMGYSKDDARVQLNRIMQQQNHHK